MVRYRIFQVNLNIIGKIVMIDLNACISCSSEFRFFKIQQFWLHLPMDRFVINKCILKLFSSASSIMTFNHFYLLQIFFFVCSLQSIVRYRLVDHIKSHTQEKSCACPNCGIMFSTYTKLKDHCRQSNKGT